MTPVETLLVGPGYFAIVVALVHLLKPFADSSESEAAQWVAFSVSLILGGLATQIVSDPPDSIGFRLNGVGQLALFDIYTTGILFMAITAGALYVLLPIVENFESGWAKWVAVALAIAAGLVVITAATYDSIPRHDGPDFLDQRF